MAFLTIFTTPKPFTNPHINTIQRNALRSWKSLGPDIDILMIGDEEGISAVAKEYEIRHIPQVECNSYGTPYIRSLFHMARQASDSQIFAFVNADIIFLPDFLQACRSTARQTRDFLLIGQRWDLRITEQLDFSEGWQVALTERCHRDGKLHPRGGSDYFAFPRHCYTDIPALVVGRAGWDNWMIYEARMQKWATIDATESVHIIHQEHDYSHLPHSQPHYRLPESIENTKLAGGEKAIFTLMDTNLRLIGDNITAIPITWDKLLREIEIFPLIQLKSEALWKISRNLVHPGRLFKRIKNRIRKSS